MHLVDRFSLFCIGGLLKSESGRGSSPVYVLSVPVYFPRKIFSTAAMGAGDMVSSGAAEASVVGAALSAVASGVFSAASGVEETTGAVITGAVTTGAVAIGAVSGALPVGTGVDAAVGAGDGVSTSTKIGAAFSRVFVLGVSMLQAVEVAISSADMAVRAAFLIIKFSSPCVTEAARCKIAQQPLR